MRMLNPEKYAQMFANEEENEKDLEKEQNDLMARDMEEFFADVKEEKLEKFDVEANKFFMDSAMEINFDEQEEEEEKKKEEWWSLKV